LSLRRNQRRSVRSLGSGCWGKVLANTPRRKRAPQSGWCSLSSSALCNRPEAAPGSRGQTQR
jgi:hypothetical protein